jgi:hypothetical protein
MQDDQVEEAAAGEESMEEGQLYDSDAENGEEEHRRRQSEEPGTANQTAMESTSMEPADSAEEEEPTSAAAEEKEDEGSTADDEDEDEEYQQTSKSSAENSDAEDAAADSSVEDGVAVIVSMEPSPIAVTDSSTVEKGNEDAKPSTPTRALQRRGPSPTKRGTPSKKPNAASNASNEGGFKIRKITFDTKSGAASAIATTTTPTAPSTSTEPTTATKPVGRTRVAKVARGGARGALVSALRGAGIAPRGRGRGRGRGQSS